MPFWYLGESAAKLSNKAVFSISVWCSHLVVCAVDWETTDDGPRWGSVYIISWVLYILNLKCFLFLRFYLFIWERSREPEHKVGWVRGRGRSRYPCWAGSLMWGMIPGLWDHDLSGRQTLNQLSSWIWGVLVKISCGEGYVRLVLIAEVGYVHSIWMYMKAGLGMEKTELNGWKSSERELELGL